MVSFLGDLLIGWRIGKTVRYLFPVMGRGKEIIADKIYGEIEGEEGGFRS